MGKEEYQETRCLHAVPETRKNVSSKINMVRSIEGGVAERMTDVLRDVQVRTSDCLSIVRGYKECYRTV